MLYLWLMSTSIQSFLSAHNLSPLCFRRWRLLMRQVLKEGQPLGKRRNESSSPAVHTPSMGTSFIKHSDLARAFGMRITFRSRLPCHSCRSTPTSSTHSLLYRQPSPSRSARDSLSSRLDEWGGCHALFADLSVGTRRITQRNSQMA